ncbi:MAG TPA: hypothetical protein VK474_11925, partial [Chthoniobacterales bacterium]|nr:hypothetical protein [Chthoniobacterales bacterium]
MAHLRAHTNSKFWYVRFLDPDTNKWREESTRLLRDDPKQTRAAQRLADKKSAREAKLGGHIRGAFREWAADYIAAHYTRDSTSRRAQFAWERVAEWLDLKGLRHPREIRHEHAREYLTWRKLPTKGLKPPAHNTALYELRFLSFLLNEAIRR